MGNFHIRVQCDNTTAVCYINNICGSKSLDCNSVARQIRDYCIERNIWISASHLPGFENTDAHRESRHFNDRTEWQLEPDIYHSITKQFGSINSARCALSAILESPASACSTFGEHPDVKRFMKGIFQSRPSLPRYCKTWDVNLVLQYIGSMGNSQELSLKDLTLKL